MSDNVYIKWDSADAINQSGVQKIASRLIPQAELPPAKPASVLLRIGEDGGFYLGHDGIEKFVMLKFDTEFSTVTIGCTKVSFKAVHRIYWKMWKSILKSIF